MDAKHIAEELSVMYNGIPFDSEVLDDGSIFVSTKLTDSSILKPFVFAIIAEETGLTYLSISFDLTKKKIKPKIFEQINEYNNLVKTLKMYINTIEGESYLEIAFFSFRTITLEEDIFNDVDYFLDSIFESEDESLSLLNTILKEIA